MRLERLEGPFVGPRDPFSKAEKLDETSYSDLQTPNPALIDNSPVFDHFFGTFPTAIIQVTKLNLSADLNGILIFLTSYKHVNNCEILA